MEFGKKLQALRKSRDLTQEALAEQLYVSRTAISKWESGRGYPSIDSLKAIAGYFSVSLDERHCGRHAPQCGACGAVCVCGKPAGGSLTCRPKNARQSIDKRGLLKYNGQCVSGDAH